MVLNNPITIEEVVGGIEKMNRRAAPGVDGIPTQCIKEAWKSDDKEDPMCHILAPHLTKLFNNIFYSGIYPDEWTVTTITPFLKDKGSKDTESNYRGISVVGALVKLYGLHTMEW